MLSAKARDKQIYVVSLAFYTMYGSYPNLLDSDYVGLDVIYAPNPKACTELPFALHKCIFRSPKGTCTSEPVTERTAPSVLWGGWATTEATAVPGRSADGSVLQSSRLKGINDPNPAQAVVSKDVIEDIPVVRVAACSAPGTNVATPCPLLEKLQVETTNFD